MRADRLAFPIPPGVHWTEVKAVILPKENAAPSLALLPSTGRGNKKTTKPKPKATTISLGRMGAPPPVVELPVVRKEKAKRVPIDRAQGRKVKLDPKYVSASRELRDRYLEEVNERGFVLESAGKYELIRASTNAADSRITTAINTPAPLLAAA